MKRAVILLILSIIMALATPIQAKVPEVKVGKGEGAVEIEADELTHDRDRQSYEAHGHVRIVRGTLSLEADHVLLNMATKDMTAWSRVVLREGEDVVECERLEFNLDTQLGKVYQARMFLKDQNFHVIAEEAEKLGEYRYRLRNGSFTTCDAQPPPWKFTAKELDVTLEGTGIVKGPTFHLGAVPILYSPWGAFPVRRERQTGFLLPTAGYSDRYGPEVKTAFYWAIAKNMDATFYLDYLGDRGFKEGLEYRYAFARETNGQTRFFFIKDQDMEENRYGLFARHEQKLPEAFYLKWDINYVSDNRYPRDFDEDLPTETKIDSRSLQQVRSTVFGGKNWDRSSLLANSQFFRILSKDDNDDTVQKLPQVGFWAHPQALWRTPFYYDLATSYTDFWREEGVAAHRWDLFPRISFPQRLLDVLKFEANVGVRETLYYLYNDVATRNDPWISRETFVASAQIGTEFYRVYEGSRQDKWLGVFGVGKWMHTIEPTIRYDYSPRVSQEEIPYFDDIDRVPFTSAITYGVTTRLLGKPARQRLEIGPREFLRLGVFQSYSLGDPIGWDRKGRGRDFSNVRAQLWANFGPYVAARVDTDFNPYDANLDRLNGLLVIRDGRNDAIQIEYRNTRDVIEALNFYARLKTIDRLFLYGGVRYNLLKKAAVENVYGVEFQHQCWIGSFSVEDIKASPDRTQKRELKFQFYLNLLGVGSLGHRSPYMTF